MSRAYTSVIIYYHVIKQQYVFILEARFSRDLEAVGFEPGSAGYQSTALPQSYRASVRVTCLLLVSTQLKVMAQLQMLYNKMTWKLQHA